MRTATYSPPPGESIHQAAANALRLADAGGRPVRFELEGIPAEAGPGETPGEVALRWFDRRRAEIVAAWH